MISTWIAYELNVSYTVYIDYILDVNHTVKFREHFKPFCNIHNPIVSVCTTQNAIDFNAVAIWSQLTNVCLIIHTIA